MGKEEIAENSKLIAKLCGQLASSLDDTELSLLFPRVDYKGLFYIPQLFIIRIFDSPIQINLSSTSSTKSIINIENRKREYVDYNVTSNPMSISINGARLTSIAEEGILKILKMSPFKVSFNKNLIRNLFIDLYNSGCYYSFFSLTTGYLEPVVLESVTLTDTVYKHTMQISLNIKVLKTFSIQNFEG